MKIPAEEKRFHKQLKKKKKKNRMKRKQKSKSKLVYGIVEQRSMNAP